MIRLTIPSIEEDDLRAVGEALATGHLVQGPRVAQFERAVGSLVRARHGIAVSNCTCALHLALLSLDVKPGDVCILPAYSWVATANAVQLCGARPEFVDIDPRTFNIDVDKLGGTLTRLMKDKSTAAKVRAVLPVHAFGQMADMPSINRLCQEWDLAVIEDAACALGATHNSKHPGEDSLMACFSFHPRKAVTTGEGGMITTNNDKAARKLRALRNHGADPESMEPDFVLPGHNYRMTEFQAALGSSQMNKLDRIITARREAAARYDSLLENTELEKPMVLPESRHVFQSYVVLLPERIAGGRAKIIKAAKSKGIEVQVGTIHIPLTTFYRETWGYKAGDFPSTDNVAARALTLPLFESITQDQQSRVIDVLLGLVRCE